VATIQPSNSFVRCLPAATTAASKGKKDKFLTVVCNLETGEPLWSGKDRKKETLDDFFRRKLVSRQRKRIEAVCVDMWDPFRKSIEQWVAVLHRQHL